MEASGREEIIKMHKNAGRKSHPSRLCSRKRCLSWLKAARQSQAPTTTTVDHFPLTSSRELGTKSGQKEPRASHWPSPCSPTKYGVHTPHSNLDSSLGDGRSIHWICLVSALPHAVCLVLRMQDALSPRYLNFRPVENSSG